MAHPPTNAILDLNLNKLKILWEEKEGHIDDISSLFPNASETRLEYFHTISMTFQIRVYFYTAMKLDIHRHLMASTNATTRSLK